MKPYHIVRSEFQFELNESKKKVDIAIERKNSKRKEDEFQTRLGLEIKETGKGALSAKEINRRIQGDVDKLEAYEKTLEGEELRNYNKAIFFFFRGADRKISDEMKRVMESIQKDLDDVLLFWGP